MNDDSLEHIERQIASAPRFGAPREMRAAVLADVERELRAARWDRRMARAAVVLLALGLGLNLSSGMWGSRSNASPQLQVAESESRESFVNTAIVVAEATDAATGRRIARQMAAISGRELTADEAAAIDAALGGTTSHDATNRNRG